MKPSTAECIMNFMTTLTKFDTGISKKALKHKSGGSKKHSSQ